MMIAVYVSNPFDGYHLFCSSESTHALKKSSSLSVSTATSKPVEPKLEVPNKGRSKSKNRLFRTLSNLKQSLSKTKLSKYKDLLKTRKRSQSPKSANFIRTVSKTNSSVTNQSHETISPSVSNNPKIQSSQTYSIHSEEGVRPSSHTVPSMETISIEGIYASDLKGKISSSTIRHYSKHCYDISDNEEQTTDDENCPLEDLVNHRLRTSK